ncbi:hypothetical protein THAOC_26686, partial [Thalassiosira oceanica]
GSGVAENHEEEENQDQVGEPGKTETKDDRGKSRKAEDKLVGTGRRGLTNKGRAVWGFWPKTRTVGRFHRTNAKLRYAN